MSYAESLDLAINKFVGKFHPRIKPEFLKLAGSSQSRHEYTQSKRQQQIDYFAKIFLKQLERGRIVPERAAAMRDCIMKDDNLLVKDAFTGMFVCGAIEKVAIAAGATAAYVAGYPFWETVVVSVGVMTANPIAVPYYIWRGKEEIAHHKNQLEQSNTPTLSKYAKLSLTSAELAVATAMNLLPFPGSLLAISSAPLLTRQRYSELSRTAIGYYLDNAREKFKIPAKVAKAA